MMLLNKADAKKHMDDYEGRLEKMTAAFDLLWKTMEKTPRVECLDLLEKFNEAVASVAKVRFDYFDDEALKYIHGRLYRHGQKMKRGRIGSVS